jgi:hypothetical protein
MLSFVYQPSFSGSPHPRPSLSLSTAASVYGRQHWLLPTLATRGAGNALKVTLADTTCTRSDTTTMNTEHAQNVILAVSGVLTTSNEGEESTEVREGKEQQRGEERKEHLSKEVHRPVSPTTVPTPIVFGQPAVHLMDDISALHSGTRNPWASLNRRHHRFHLCKPCSPTHMVSCLAHYSTGSGLNKSPALPSPLPVPTGIIETIWHPLGISPAKPVIVVPITTSFIAPHAQTITHCHHERLTHINTKVPAMALSECITPLRHSSTLISDIVAFSSTISSHLLSFFSLSEATRASP